MDAETRAYHATQSHYDSGFKKLREALSHFEKAQSFGMRAKRNTLVRNARMICQFIEGALRNLAEWDGSEAGGQ